MNANLNKPQSKPESSSYVHSAVMSPTTSTERDARNIDSSPPQLQQHICQVTNSSDHHLIEVRQDMYNGNSDSPSGSDSSSSTGSGSDRESSPVAQDCSDPQATGQSGVAGGLQMQGE